MIPHNKPTIGKEETAAVARVLKSGWIAEGKKVEEFENAVCKYIGVPAGSAVAVSSGTAALYLALIALDIKKGKEVIVPTYVCSAVLNAVIMAGAKPVIVDIEGEDLNISLSEIKKKINKKTGAIVAVHTFGMPADVKRLITLGIPVIEDCAQAIGARIHGKSVGTFGTIVTFSFYASKMLTSGNGGMVVSRNKQLIKRLLDYREFDGRRDYKPRFNFQMSDVQAALGLVQLKRLPSFLKRRAQIAEIYRKALSKTPMWPARGGKQQPNFYRILLRTPHAANLKKFLDTKGIKTIIPIERFELLHRYLKENPKHFPVSERIAKETLSLPTYPSLSNAEVRKIIAAIRAYLKI